MYRKILMMLLILALLQPFAAVADEKQQDSIPTEEINVTASRTETAREKTGSSVTVITSKQMERSKKTSLEEYLKEVPGLTVIPSGPRGQITTVSIRGALTEQTLVMIDGTPVNDPSSPGGGFNFSGIPVESIDRIEIVRGPQSTVYGSKSIGGVINIITKGGKPGKDVVKVSGTVEAGGYGSNNFNLNLLGSTNNAAYFFGSTASAGDLLSAAGTKYGNTENDPFSNFETYGKLNYRPSNNTELGIFYRNSNQSSALDLGSGPMADAVGYWTRAKSNLFRGHFDYAPVKNWNSRITVSSYDIIRDVFGNPFNPPGYVENYKGISQMIDWQNTVKAGSHTFVAGINNENESAVFTDFDPFTFLPVITPQKNASIFSVYAQDSIDITNRMFVTAGARYDNHSISGSKTTGRITASGRLAKGLYLKGSWGSGFKAPTLYQLYSSYGNQLLRPETSSGWDAGLEYRSPDRLHCIGLTFFDNRLDNLIDFDMVTYQYYNINKAYTSGIEAWGSTALSRRFSLRGNYTYLKTKDELTGLELLRRPRNKLVFGANYDIVPEKLALNGDMIYTGIRQDLDFSSLPSTKISLPGYTLFNAALSYKVNKNLETYIRAENIFNKQYEAVWGYSYPGTTIYGGLKFGF